MSDQKPPEQRGPRVTISPEIALGQYSNFVTIAHNYSEVLFDFGRTLPGRNDIPVVARLIMNPFQAKQLLRALTHNLQMYEQKFGPVNDPPSGAGEAPPDGAN